MAKLVIELTDNDFREFSVEYYDALSKLIDVSYNFTIEKDEESIDENIESEDSEDAEFFDDDEDSELESDDEDFQIHDYTIDDDDNVELNGEEEKDLC